LLLLQPIAQLLAGPEKRHVLLGDLDAVAGARIAADAGLPPPDREAPNPRSSTRSPRVKAAAISSKIAVTMASTSR
jgi:hypothetical protein